MKKNWTYKKLGEVFDLQMGKTPSRDNVSYWGGSNVWISISDIKNKYVDDSKEHITDKAVADSKIKKINAGTVIMSFKLTVGRAAITTTDIYTNEAIMAFIPKDGYNLLPDYIYYYLKGHKWSGTNKAVMGLTLNKATISQNMIVIPPLPIQEKIVSELDCINGILDNKRQQLKELDALAQSLFYQMFGDPINNEKGWEVKKLGEVCEITSSKRIFAEEYVESGIPFYRSKEVIEKSKGEPISVELFISEDRYKEVKEAYGVPTVGDILITAVGTIGKIWLVDSDEPFYFKDGNLVWLRNIQQIESVFFKTSLFYLIDEYKKVNANGAAYNALTIVKLKQMDCPLPPLPLQQSFASKIEAIEKQKELIKQSIADTETLLASRMQYWFD